jgi:hypothetical protein
MSKVAANHRVAAFRLTAFRFDPQTLTLFFDPIKELNIVGEPVSLSAFINVLNRAHADFL